VRVRGAVLAEHFVEEVFFIVAVQQHERGLVGLKVGFRNYLSKIEAK
jgi:hypothetical protein